MDQGPYFKAGATWWMPEFPPGVSLDAVRGGSGTARRDRRPDLGHRDRTRMRGATMNERMIEANGVSAAYSARRAPHRR